MSSTDYKKIAPTPKPVTKNAKDPNSLAPDFPDTSLQPDTIFHGGSGKSLPPSQPGPSAKMSVDILKTTPLAHGRAVHDAFGSVDHAPSGDIASQPAPVKSKATAPVRNDLK